MAQILVAGHDTTTRERVAATLVGAGHAVRAVADAGAGLRDTAEPVDLVVAVLRLPRDGQVLSDRDLEVDLERHEVRVAGRPLALTGREFDLLRFLMTHPGSVWSRRDLLRDVWGWEFGDDSTVTVHVRRLRGKVEADPSHPVRLVTVWGLGYRWEAA
ncbi:DNA-binding response regulator [Actinotalea sp. M2MS4P-6]|uniref:response regulator transcription factor n=1 Tax=Actinotalea sp. M2MS4P-6 TaxID=2983762 RepID=UPI00398C7D18